MALARTGVMRRLSVGVSPRTDDPAQIIARPADNAVARSTAHIRRCTYRRVAVRPHGRRELAMYDVECGHPSYDTPIPLGAMAAAYDACATCVLPGIFRPDED